MTTKTLLNHYLYEVNGIVASVHSYYVEDGTITIMSDSGSKYFVPLLEYITFMYNKLQNIL